MDEYVKRQLSSVPGHIGFYYKNLVTGETDGSRQTELFQAASVIKLPILAAILLEEREHPGVLQERLLVRDGRQSARMRRIAAYLRYAGV